MTLDKAIKRFSDNAEYERSHGSLQGCLEFRQLAEWLTELKELKEQTEPCGEDTNVPTTDAISRQAVKEQMIKQGFHAPDMTVTEFVEELPSVQPEQRTGTWKRQIVDSGYNADWKCSECGYKEMTDFPTKYCPNCGAKMVEPQESEGAKC